MRTLHKLSLLLIPFALSACLESKDTTDTTPPPPPPPPPTTYTVGGNITGLTAAGLVLKNNGADDLIVNAGVTSFTFLTPQADGAGYNVTVGANPTGMGCSVNNGSGTIAAANVTNVEIRCVPKNELVSRSSDDSIIAGYYGAQLGFHNMSRDGRFVVFEASKTGLASGATSASIQIFLRDRQTNTTTLISRASGANGTEGNQSSYEPAVSDDGRYVVFESYADNLVTGDTLGHADIFIRDTQLQTTTRLSVGFDGSEADWYSSTPSISADGRYVAFQSYAHNIVNGNYGDLYLLDLQSKTITTIDLAADGSKPNGGGAYPMLSADGSRIAFWSYASNLGPVDTNGIWDIYVYDRVGGTKTLASVSTNGTQKDQGSESMSRLVRPAISGDGKVVAFATTATNLVSGDTNGKQDVFVRNLATQTTTRASVDSNGVQGNADSPMAQGERVALSYDGSLVVFSTLATNLASGATSGESVLIHDNATGATNTITNSPSWYAGTYGPTISGDGRYVGFLSSEYLDPRFSSNSGLYVQDRTVQ